MKAKREVIESHEAWRRAATELDAAIGVELDGDGRDGSVEVVDIRRFRRALLEERRARMRYVAALQADNRPVPEELVWDVPELSGEV